MTGAVRVNILSFGCVIEMLILLDPLPSVNDLRYLFMRCDKNMVLPVLFPSAFDIDLNMICKHRIDTTGFRFINKSLGSQNRIVFMCNYDIKCIQF